MKKIILFSIVSVIMLPSFLFISPEVSYACPTGGCSCPNYNQTVWYAPGTVLSFSDGTCAKCDGNEGKFVSIECPSKNDNMVYWDDDINFIKLFFEKLYSFDTEIFNIEDFEIFSGLK